MIGRYIGLSRVDGEILGILAEVNTPLSVSTLTAQVQNACPLVTTETIEGRLDMLHTKGLVVFTQEGSLQPSTPLALTGH